MRVIIFIFSFLFLTAACKTQYVPIETIRTEKEYVDRWQRDSIYLHDSIWVERKGDTLWLEKHKTYYKEIVKRDSIFVIDSIKVEIPYPVIEIKEINRLQNWQIFLMCLGGVFVGYFGYRLLKWWR